MPTESGAGIKKFTTDDLKNKLMHSATTSNYFLSINVPNGVKSHIQRTKGFAITPNLRERINIACTSATLPGSSFATHDVTSDYMGVTEKMAYRRMYDDQMSVQMIVDPEYKTLHFFEGWMDFISGKSINDRGNNENYKNFRNGFRMNYPDGSTSNNRESVNQGYRDKNVIELYKFERDTSVNQSIKYTMIEGYPLSMNAMDINYGATDLLRLTVNFTFVRYVTEPYSTGATSTVGTPPAIAPGTSLNLNFLNQSGELSLPSQNTA